MATTKPPSPPLVLIHAYLTDHTVWDLVVAQMKVNSQIIVPDLPGFGNTPVLRSTPCIDALADHIAQLLREQHIQKAVIAGMSMGGYVALAFAERHREMLAGLGLISTQSTADSPAMRRLRRSIVSSVRRNGPAIASAALLPKLFSAQRQNDPTLVQLATESAKTASAEGICWALEAMAQRLDKSELLKTIHVPTLVLHGTEDEAIPAARAREMAGLLPQSKLVEIPGAGHATPWEAPVEVARSLSHLLACVIGNEP